MHSARHILWNSTSANRGFPRSPEAGNLEKQGTRRTTGSSFPPWAPRTNEEARVLPPLQAIACSASLHAFLERRSWAVGMHQQARCADSTIEKLLRQVT